MHRVVALVFLVGVAASACHEEFIAPEAPDLYKAPRDFGIGAPADLSASTTSTDLSVKIDMLDEHDLAMRDQG